MPHGDLDCYEITLILGSTQKKWNLGFERAWQNRKDQARRETQYVGRMKRLSCKAERGLDAEGGSRRNRKMIASGKQWKKDALQAQKKIENIMHMRRY